MVGYGQAVHAEFGHALYQAWNPVRPVEQRVFRMRMEVDETHRTLRPGVRESVASPGVAGLCDWGGAPTERTRTRRRRVYLHVHRNKLPGTAGIVKMLENAVCCDIAEGYEQVPGALGLEPRCDFPGIMHRMKGWRTL